jgi:hypothetical protein
MNSEDIEKLVLATRINSWTLRASAALFCIVCIFSVTFMIETSSRITRLEATIITSENIVKLKRELDTKLNGFISARSYVEMESSRAMVIIDYLDYICAVIGVREEELEKGRTTAIRNLRLFTTTGTTRSGNQR